MGGAIGIVAGSKEALAHHKAYFTNHFRLRAHQKNKYKRQRNYSFTFQHSACQTGAPQ